MKADTVTTEYCLPLPMCVDLLRFSRQRHLLSSPAEPTNPIAQTLTHYGLMSHSINTAANNDKKPSKRPKRSRAGSKKDSSKSAVSNSSARASSNSWTFLTNHAHVLAILHSKPEMVLREVALAVGITERAVQRIVHELEEEGFLQVKKVGRRNRYTVDLDQPLRHPIESHHTIGEIITLVCDE